MNVELYIIIPLLSAVASAVTNYLGFGMKAYISRKMENLASKQDLAEITRKVEEVKKELNVLTANEIALKNEARGALIEFNETIAKNISQTLSIFGDLDYTDRKRMQILFTSHSLLPMNLQFSITKVGLFIEDEEVIKGCKELATEVNLFSQSIFNFISSNDALYKQNKQLDSFNTEDLGNKLKKALTIQHQLSIRCRQYLYK